MAGLAPHDGHRAAACRRRKRWRSSPRRCRAAFRTAWPPAHRPDLPPAMPGLPPKFPGLPGPRTETAGTWRRCRRNFPDLGRRNDADFNFTVIPTHEPERQTLRNRRQITQRKDYQCPSSSAWPAPAPRSGRSITSSPPTAARRATAASSSGSATSIRCCRRTRTERLKLDIDKVKAWMAKGAQPSDRVMRFLDAAGVAKREKRNNPEKAIPRKERKAEGREARRPQRPPRPRPRPRPTPRPRRRGRCQGRGEA